MYDLLSGGDEPVKGDRENVAPGEAHNWGRKRAKAFEEGRRARMEEFKRLNSGTFDPIAPVGSGLNGFGLGGATGSSPIDAIISKAGEAKTMLAGLSDPVNPSINLAPVQELVRLSQQALDNLTRLGGAAGAAKSALSGIGSAPSGRGRSDVATATAKLSTSRQSNYTDRSYVG